MTELLTLAGVCASLSLAAFGGADAVMPGLAREAVRVHGWMSAQEFAWLYALGRAAPGPNLLVFTLVGWRVAGLAGATVATVAFVLPSALLAFAASAAWRRIAVWTWRRGLQAGLGALAAGLVGGTAWTLAQAATTGVISALLLLLAAGAALLWRGVPLLLLGGSAAAGVVLGL